MRPTSRCIRSTYPLPVRPYCPSSTVPFGTFRPCAPSHDRSGSNMRKVQKSKLGTTLALGAGMAALFAAGAFASEFKVPMNETRPLQLSKPAATVMVGNPAIADVAIESTQLLYVMGRNYGTTNLIALDAEGKTILDMKLSVTAQGTSAVTLTRGTGQFSYNCTPRCERIAVIGDDEESFDMLMQQGASMNSTKSDAGGSDAGSGGGTATMR
ncbi:MAG: hypothetical protein C0454_03125 [Parvibaculum sp.]|nr:hypothetical protein [Parvibaculum sp.]